MMRRWTFTDADAVLPAWTFPVNPSRHDPPEVGETISAEPMAVDGSNRDLPQPTPPSSWTWEGLLYTLADLDTMEAWLNHGRPINLTDHQGQHFTIQLVSVEATRNGSRHFPQRHKYTANALMLSRTITRDA